VWQSAPCKHSGWAITLAYVSPQKLDENCLQEHFPDKGSWYTCRHKPAHVKEQQYATIKKAYTPFKKLSDRSQPIGHYHFRTTLPAGKQNMQSKNNRKPGVKICCGRRYNRSTMRFSLLLLFSIPMKEKRSPRVLGA
jgi:hypothetical protein